MDDDLLGLQDPVPSVTAEVVEPSFEGLLRPRVPASLSLLTPEPTTLAMEQENKLKGIRNEIHARASFVVDSVLAFAEVDPEADVITMPAGWVEEFGEEGARRRLRIAKAAWMSGKEAPIAIKVATETLAGLEAAKAAEKGPRVQLNVGKLEMNFAMPTFAEERVDE